MITPVSGEPDLDYLRAALARIDRPVDVTEVERIALRDGRSGARVERLVLEQHRYVLKVLASDRWVDTCIGERDRGEVKLWASGAQRALPLPLACPTLDVACHVERGEHWLLMEDVSDGIRPRGEFREADTRKLFRGLAQLHARYWERDDELARLPLASLAASTRLFAEPALHVAGRETPGWAAHAADEFSVVRELLPRFLELLGTVHAELYLSLCAERAPWLDPLENMPATLLHGDLRRANIALLSDRVALFDWDLATRGSAACDLQWHLFLTYWAYPADADREPASRRDLVDDYLDHLEAALGRRIDRMRFDRALELAFVRTFVQLGYCMSDALPRAHDRDAIVSVRRRCRAAVERARRAVEAS